MKKKELIDDVGIHDIHLLFYMVAWWLSVTNFLLSHQSTHKSGDLLLIWDIYLMVLAHAPR